MTNIKVKPTITGIVVVLISFIILGLVLPSLASASGLSEQKGRKYRIKSSNIKRAVRKELRPASAAFASATFVQHDGNQTIIKTTEITTSGESANGNFVWSFLSGKWMKQFIQDVFIGSQSQVITTSQPDQCSYFDIPKEFRPKDANYTPAGPNRINGKCTHQPFAYYIGHSLGSLFNIYGGGNEDIQKDGIDNRISVSDTTATVTTQNSARLNAFLKNLIWKMVKTDNSKVEETNPSQNGDVSKGIGFVLTILRALQTSFSQRSIHV